MALSVRTHEMGLSKRLRAAAPATEFVFSSDVRLAAGGGVCVVMAAILVVSAVQFEVYVEQQRTGAVR